MNLQGKAWRFGDDVSTDLIIPYRYVHLRPYLDKLAKHVLEDADPEFAGRVQPGDFVVAGSNFGQGSSREHAAWVIKLAGVSAVLAKSFARIFFRNAINIGLPVIICNTDGIAVGDRLQVDLTAGQVWNETQGVGLQVTPLPPVMLQILNDGGLAAHLNKHGGFNLDTK